MKVKEWIKKQWVYHKKEIIVAAVSVVGTVAVIHLKQKGKVSFGASVRINIGDCDFPYGEKARTNHGHINFSLNDPDLTIGDLGKLGEVIMKNVPILTKDLPVTYSNVSGSYPL